MCSYFKTKSWLLLINCFFIIVFYFSISPFCHSADVIYTNQTFKEGDLLVSKANKFAFGFFSPGSSSNRYLGIWYHEISERSVVWVANRDDPINGSSAVLSINQYGNLVLYSDPDKQVMLWSTNVTDKVTDGCMVQILDSGNLVLLEVASRKIVWQSFNHPTDTVMPGMRFGRSEKSVLEWYVTAWRAANDPGTGEFKFKLTPGGSPQYVLYKGSRPRWRDHLWPSRRFTTLFNYSYVINQDEMYIVHYITDASVVLKAMVDHLGFFKWLTWHHSDGQWKEYFSVPKYPCDFYAQCGAYGICSPDNPKVFECSCLPGYEPKSPRDWNLRDASQGCIRKRLRSSSFCKHGEGFVKVENVKISDTSNAAWIGTNMSRKECEQHCLVNCSCTAYTTIDKDENETGCLAWYGELMDTVKNKDGNLHMHVVVDAVELAEIARKSNPFLRKERTILLLPIGVAWFTIVLFVCLWLRRKRKKGMKDKSEGSVFPISSSSNYYTNTSEAHEFWEITLFDLSSIFSATNNFSPDNKLGRGGFGSVYRGQLANGQEIAVKRLSKNSRQGIEEFKNEVRLISKLQHKNLVKLFGCCICEEEKMLIYEYLPNKSLDFFIFDIVRKALLDWTKRFEIIVGIGRGLLYLHQDSRLKVIHRDLKASNVLLDSAMNPKISDFGLARIFGEDQIHANTNRIAGTHGYMSPEYAMEGLYSTKSDVFSYGVLTLEIISGRKNSDCYDHENLSLNLVGHVWDLWRAGKVLDVVDSTLEESYPISEVLRCIQIGLLCVQECPSDRPTMLAALSLLLSNEATLPSPKKPAFIFEKWSSNSVFSADNTVLINSANDVTITNLVAR